MGGVRDLRAPLPFGLLILLGLVILWIVDYGWLYYYVPVLAFLAITVLGFTSSIGGFAGLVHALPRTTGWSLLLWVGGIALALLLLGLGYVAGLFLIASPSPR